MLGRGKVAAENRRVFRVGGTATSGIYAPDAESRPTEREKTAL